jgi:hypothetical protein
MPADLQAALEEALTKLEGGELEGARSSFQKASALAEVHGYL